MASDDGTLNPNELGASEMGSEPNLAELVGDILSVDNTPTQEHSKPVKPSKNSYKPKGLFLGERRDNGKPVDIAPQVLARHAAMLGSTGSGKTVMAKALIEEAAIAKIPSLIIDPQGDLARLALGIAPADLEEHGGDYARAKKLLDMCEVRIWTPLRSKGLPLCIDPFRAPPADLDSEEAITAWDMVAAGFTSLAGYDVEKAQGKVVKPFLYEVLVE
jgi:type IV secretory pathway VirB4 component